MEPNIHALGMFWLHLFFGHSLRLYIVCLHQRLVLFMAHLLDTLLHVHGLPHVDEWGTEFRQRCGRHDRFNDLQNH